MRLAAAFGWSLVGAVGLSCIAVAADADQKAKWEEMKQKHEDCLKSSGAFDQPTLDALADCHKSAMKDHEGKPEKGDREGWKAAIDACLKDKGVTLSQAQQDAMKSCHHHHKEK